MAPWGIYLGTWRDSGLPAARSNAVYGSRDALMRINRRVSKETQHGQVVLGGNYDVRRTACKHENIDYCERYQGLTKAQQLVALQIHQRAGAEIQLANLPGSLSGLCRRVTITLLAPDSST